MRNKSRDELLCSIAASVYFNKVASMNGGIGSLGRRMGVGQSVASEYAKCDGASSDIPFYRWLMASNEEKIAIARLLLKGIAKVEPTQFDDLNGEVIDEFLEIVANDGELAIQVKMKSVNVETINKAIDLLCKMKAEL